MGMVRIYTRTGDDGETFCFALGGRVKKYHPMMELVGSLDEANSALGLAREICREECENREVLDLLSWAQRLLFYVGFALNGNNKFDGTELARLESITDKLMGDYQFQGFILPGGSRAAAAIHVARALVRRAERRFFEVLDTVLEGGSEELRYAGRVLNRLSDALYAAAVRVALESGGVEYL